MKVPTLPSYYEPIAVLCGTNNILRNIINFQVDITFIIPKLISGVNHMPKKLNGFSDPAHNGLSN